MGDGVVGRPRGLCAVCSALAHQFRERVPPHTNRSGSDILGRMDNGLCAASSSIANHVRTIGSSLRDDPHRRV
eukprot:1251336-Amphidinium_carterae.2